MSSKPKVSLKKYESLKSKAESWRETSLELSNEKIQLELSVENLQDELSSLKEQMSEQEEEGTELRQKYKELRRKNRELNITNESQKQTINFYSQILSQNMLLKNNI